MMPAARLTMTGPVTEEMVERTTRFIKIVRTHSAIAKRYFLDLNDQKTRPSVAITAKSG
jgi:hypothetical protein